MKLRWWRRERRDPNPSLDPEVLARVAAVQAWWLEAWPWLEANPDQQRALDLWEAEFVTGDGVFGVNNWPGWLACPAGPMPMTMMSGRR